MAEDWPVIDRAVEYDPGWYSGGYDLVEQPDGTRKRYYWASLPPAVVVVAIDGDTVIMVEQYRPIIREHHLELPAGIVEDDESYVEAGKRELREETGYVAGSVDHIQTYAVATGVLRHDRGVVVATELEQSTPDRDQNEFLRVTRVPVADALERAREKPANDSTISSLLLAKADGYL